MFSCFLVAMAVSVPKVSQPKRRIFFSKGNSRMGKTGGAPTKASCSNFRFMYASSSRYPSFASFSSSSVFISVIFSSYSFLISSTDALCSLYFSPPLSKASSTKQLWMGHWKHRQLPSLGNLKQWTLGSFSTSGMYTCFNLCLLYSIASGDSSSLFSLFSSSSFKASQDTPCSGSNTCPSISSLLLSDAPTYLSTLGASTSSTYSSSSSSFLRGFPSSAMQQASMSSFSLMKFGSTFRRRSSLNSTSPMIVFKTYNFSWIDGSTWRLFSLSSFCLFRLDSSLVLDAFFYCVTVSWLMEVWVFDCWRSQLARNETGNSGCALQTAAKPLQRTVPMGDFSKQEMSESSVFIVTQ